MDMEEDAGIQKRLKYGKYLNSNTDPHTNTIKEKNKKTTSL